MTILDAERALMEKAFIDAYDDKNPHVTHPFVILEDGSIVVVAEGDPLAKRYPLQQVVRTVLGDVRIVL